MFLKGKQVLVTGGAGFIGSHLVDLLVDLGCRVRILDNLVTGKLANLAGHSGSRDVDLIEGSVTETAQAYNALAGVDVVFHLACLGVRHSLLHPRENHRVNAGGSLTVARSACDRGVSLYVHISTSEVYGTALSVPMNEDHPTRPRTVYGASKLAGEAYVRALRSSRGLPAMVLRPFNTFGPRSHHEGLAGELIPKSIVRALTGEPPVIFGDGDQTRDFTYVTDVARALVSAARCEYAVGRTLNVGSGSEITVRRLVGMIASQAGHQAREPRRMPRRPGDVDRLCSDASRFRALTGWAPEVGLEEGLTRTVDWFRHHPAGIRTLAGEEVARNWEGVR